MYKVNEEAIQFVRSIMRTKPTAGNNRAMYITLMKRYTVKEVLAIIRKISENKMIEENGKNSVITMGEWSINVTMGLAVEFKQSYKWLLKELNKHNLIYVLVILGPDIGKENDIERRLKERVIKTCINRLRYYRRCNLFHSN